MLEERIMVATTSPVRSVEDSERRPPELRSSSIPAWDYIDQRERAEELGKHIRVLPGRLCLLRLPEERTLYIPNKVVVDFERANMLVPHYEWPIWIVVASGIPEWPAGSFVRTKFEVDRRFRGGEYDPESPTISALLEPGEQLAFFLPFFHIDETLLNRKRKTLSQVDIGDAVIGV